MKEQVVTREGSGGSVAVLLARATSSPYYKQRHADTKSPLTRTSLFTRLLLPPGQLDSRSYGLVRNRSYLWR